MNEETNITAYADATAFGLAFIMCAIIAPRFAAWLALGLQ